jgi:MinD superfamily P-loop ATPase
MRIAVASGKGGTGKTTVAVSLALALAADGPVSLIDLDVEAPNAHLFLGEPEEDGAEVFVAVPVVDETDCTACGECAEACEFNAIVSFGTTAMVFPELCHACGGCARVCPTGAIREMPRAVGRVDAGTVRDLRLVRGMLNVGEARAAPVIQAAKARAREGEVTVLDSPPGANCPMVAAVREADVALLVTEPTPFGLHDLAIAVETVRALGVPIGVLVNRADLGWERAREACVALNVPLWCAIPDDRRVAEAYARGRPAVEALPGLRDDLRALGERLRAEATA